MAKDQNTKKRILDIAENLIISRGYNSFSYKDISLELRVKNAAIHYHFPSKKDLGLAIIKHDRAIIKEWDEMVLNQEISPDYALNQYIEAYIRYAESGKNICLAGSLGADFHTLPEDMQCDVRKLQTEILTFMTNILSEGRKSGVFTFSGTDEDKALLVVSSFQGAVQIARATNKNLFRHVIEQVKSEIGL